MKRQNKKAPAGQTAKGSKQRLPRTYQIPTGLSIAAQIIVLLTQTRAYARQQRRECWRGFDEVLRSHYDQEVGDGA